MSDIAGAIVIAAAICSLAYCTVEQDRTRADERRQCLDRGGYVDHWTDECTIKGRNA